MPLYGFPRRESARLSFLRSTDGVDQRQLNEEQQIIPDSPVVFTDGTGIIYSDIVWKIVFQKPFYSNKSGDSECIFKEAPCSGIDYTNKESLRHVHTINELTMMSLFMSVAGTHVYSLSLRELRVKVLHHELTYDYGNKTDFLAY